MEISGQNEEHFDVARLIHARNTSPEHKSAFGQFLTSSRIARFMASLFTQGNFDSCRLLDPGAGLGSLTGALLERWEAGELPFLHMDVTAFEIDVRLQSELFDTMTRLARLDNLTSRVLGGDFIEQAVYSIQGFGSDSLSFTHAILNPPYKKIGVHSLHRHLLRKVGIETVNLYTGFLGLTIRLMQTNGQIVAIIPRSFCNGPYYRPFRDLLLDSTAIRHIHLFASRSNAFKEDAVLQENVILMVEKDAKQGDVTISTSTDGTFSDFISRQVPFEQIVADKDSGRFIHIPTSPGTSEVEQAEQIRYTLTETGVQVSTGPIVDFRMREHLRDTPVPGSVPLIYPGHFKGQEFVWPNPTPKKANAIMVAGETARLLYPIGFYVVVRRFSSKEESRRIVANVISPADLDSPLLAFENHVNVFHNGKRGLSEDIARGLCAFLNSTAIDTHFRRFNGHTQVNATDLRSMKYPSVDALIILGRWAKSQGVATQAEIDEKFRQIA